MNNHKRVQDRETPQRFDIRWSFLPKQPLSYKILGVERDLEGAEFHGAHPFLVWAVDPFNRWVSGIPLTSACTATGEEKWGVWKHTWARIFVDNKPNMCDVAQLRLCDRQRISKKICRLGDFDIQQVSLKLRGTLGLL
jgi:hypothetical protein